MVIVVAALDALDILAETVAVPAFSEILLLSRDSVTLAESSSSNIRSLPRTSPMAWAFAAVPVTAVVRSSTSSSAAFMLASSFELSTAMMVAVSLLSSNWPAGMVMVLSAPAL